MAADAGALLLSGALARRHSLAHHHPEPSLAVLHDAVHLLIMRTAEVWLVNDNGPVNGFCLPRAWTVPGLTERTRARRLTDP